MNTKIPTDRLAGALYLVVVVTGVFSLMYVPTQVTITDGPGTVANHLAANAAVFRGGIAAFVINQVAFLMLPFALFSLLHTVHKSAAVSMVALAVAGVPIALIGVVFKLVALDVLEQCCGQSIASDQRDSLAMMFLNGYDNALLVATLFWGLWLLPFGYLVIRSGFLPRSLGALLILGGLGYLAQVILEILASQTGVPGWILLPAAGGEIGICLWLLFIGIGKRQSRAIPYPSK